MMKTLITFFLIISQWSFAQLKVADIFTDNAVLQQGMNVPVWGTADSGANVTVTFAGQKKVVTADTTGKWQIKLDPLEATYTERTLEVSSGKQAVSLRSIVVGEVWICSGQSNMQMEWQRVPTAKALVPMVKHVRTFEVKQTVALEESDHLVGEWQQAPPSSAVAMAFSHFLQQAGDVPVGVILSSWGSSAIEAWMPREMTSTVPHFKTIMEEFDANQILQAEIKAIISKKRGWTKKEDILLRRQMNILYNAMIHPLIPYANRGLVWYQGERNSQSMEGMVREPWHERHSGILRYGDTLKQWIKTYRKLWNNEEMHFVVIMLPKYDKKYKTGPQKGPKNPASHSWAWMRESQLQALELSNTSVVNTIDLGHASDIHPVDKVPVGKRAAAIAANATLEIETVASGPVMKVVKQEGGSLVVSYKHAEGLKTIDGEAPRGFWVAAKPNQWVRATAEINGTDIILSAKKVKKPLYVRYAFVGVPDVNLVNSAELPALPFRTDTFAP